MLSTGCKGVQSYAKAHRRYLGYYGAGTGSGFGRTQNYARTYPVVVLDEAGVAAKERVSIAEVMRRTGIHARDLVSLNLENEAGAFTTQSHLLVREGAILVGMGYMRVLIERNCCTIFRPAAPLTRTAVLTLSEMLGDRDAAHSNQPFEMVVLEGILRLPLWLLLRLALTAYLLRDVVETYYRRVQIMKPVVESFIKQISERPVENVALRQLLPLKDGLASLDDKTSQVLRPHGFFLICG
jgi:hypothetical protein